MAGATQLGEEQSLTTEQGVLDAADELDVVIHRLRHGYQATGIHTEHFAGSQLALYGGATRMDVNLAIALELLHDESLATEESSPEAFLEGDADAYSLCRCQEASLLADQFALVVQ